MKKIKRVMSSLFLVSLMALVGCSKGGDSNKKSNNGSNNSGQVADEEFKVTYAGKVYTGESGAATISINDNAAILVPSLETNDSATFSYESSDTSVLTVATTGKLTAIKAGTSVVTISYSTNSIVKITFTVTQPANAVGGHSYASVDYDEKSRILGALEKYAVDNYLTGITIFSNGSKVAYNARYIPQAQSYISGYGWGTMREGKLNGELPNAASGKPTYYNVGTTSLPAHANAMNASGSDVSTVYDYIATSYFGTRMNQTNDGYEWYPILATDERPIAVEEPVVNTDGTVKTPGAVIADTDARHNSNRRWRIHLRSDVKYRSNSQNATSRKYEGANVQLEDYLTPIKFMLTAWNGQYRGSEMTDGVSGFTGAATYYGKTASKPSTLADDAIINDEAWNTYMGSNVYTGHDDDGDFIEFNLLESCTQFYAMYYLSSSLYSPLPAEFLKYWTGTYVGKSDTARNATPVDTMLSTGPYYIESWENGKSINFKKNDQYFIKKDTFKTLGGTQERDVYNIDGIAYNVAESSTLASNFLAGKFDSYAPKATELATGGDFASDSGTSSSGVKWNLYETKGDSNFKLNVNASTESDWLKRFGPSGTNAQVDTSTSTWTKLNKDVNGKVPETACKPYMSNIHFLNFLSFSIDRKSICEARGSTPTQDYFSDNYLIDPESGVSYNSTDAHKAVLSDRFNDTYGYNETYATSELRKAFEEVIEPLSEQKAFNTKSSGGNAGTKSNPYLIPIDMEWMNTTDSSEYSDVFTHAKSIFEKVSSEDYNGAYELSIKETQGNSDYQQVYTLMKQGQFDLGFGSISGNSLNPINFLEVLKSDNSSTFTLNWGPDTDVVGDGLYEDGNSKNYIVYDNKYWSFDSLWQAADTGVALTNSGAIAEVENASTKGVSGGTFYDTVDAVNEAMSYKISFKKIIEAGATSIKFDITNSSSEDGWESYTVGYEQDGYKKLDLDSNDVGALTIGSNYNYTAGTTSKVEANRDKSVTLTISYKANLIDHSTGETLTKDFTQTMKLLTYTGYLSNNK